jgi:PAS domain S-box-containing protein
LEVTEDIAMAEDERDQSLRRKAERLVGIELATLEHVTPDQMRHLVHELQVHQIELQMQNEELRSAQDELERSRKKYFELYDLAPVAYLTLDVDGVILEANLRAADLLGHPRSHLLRRKLEEFVSVSQAAFFAEHLRAVAKTDGRRTCELELVRRDRSPVVVHLETVRINVAEKERAWELRTSITDIAERKRAEARVQDAERFARKINESSLNGIYIYNIEREEIVYINHECERLTGYTPDDLVALSGEAFFSLFLPENRSQVREYITRVSQAGDGDTREIECRFKTADDRWIWCLSRNTIFERDKDGKARTIIGTFLDVTAHKQAEEALSQAHERAVWLARFPEENPSPVVRVSADGPVLYCNPAASQLPGWVCEVGKPPPEPLLSIVTRAMATGQDPHQDMELGGRFYSVWIARFPRESYANVYGRDITQRRQAEEALREREEALQRANEQLEEKVRERTAELRALNEDLMERRDQLRSLASELIVTEARERRALAEDLHDTLAQTLASAKLTLESTGAQLDGKPAAEVKTAVDLIRQGLLQTRSLVSDLSLSLLYEDGLEAAIRELARKMGGVHSLTIKVLDDGRSKPLREESQVLLYRAVQELFHNVVKHAKATTVKVSLQREGKQVRIEVEDDGVGFHATERGREYGRGEGFGLFSIRERLQHLGGSFEIFSEPRRGARAILIAPLQVKGEGEGKEPAAVTILIAEDHRMMRDALVALLEKESGFEVVGLAEDGLEAVNLAREANPNVVLMDIQMPRMDGIEATRQITAALPEIKVIGLSVHAEHEIASKMLAAGATSFVSKNSSPEELIEAIWSTVRSE